MPKVELYPRKDGKWAWRLRANNGQIVATDGGQGYSSLAMARSMVQKVITGAYAEARTVTFFEPQ